jgi:hypothetical protein
MDRPPRDDDAGRLSSLGYPLVWCRSGPLQDDLPEIETARHVSDGKMTTKGAHCATTRQWRWSGVGLSRFRSPTSASSDRTA